MSTTTTRIINSNIREQERRAIEMMDNFLVYARSIGCTVVHDEIECNEAQSRLLHKWWTEHARWSHKH